MISPHEKVAQLKSDSNWSLQAADLIIRVFTGDLLIEPFIKGMHDPQVNQFLEVRHNLPTFADQLEFIEDNLADPTSLYLAISTKSENTLIGSLRLSEISDFHRRCYMGIMIVNKNHWGKGYASQVIAAVTEFAHSRLDIRRIAAGCYATNLGSKGAFLKAGYNLEAEIVANWSTGTQENPGPPISEFIMSSISLD